MKPGVWWVYITYAQHTLQVLAEMQNILGEHALTPPPPTSQKSYQKHVLSPCIVCDLAKPLQV